MTRNTNRIAAQIACEYIINERGAGWTNADRLAVLDAAMESGVGDLYVDEVVVEIQRAAMVADSDSTGAAL